MVRRVSVTEEGLAFAGPVDVAALVRSGEVHPREVVELTLRRIEALNPPLNAFRTVLAEEALAAAEQVSRDGPLAGVPIAIKGDTPVAGQVTTRGSRSYGPAEAADAEVVRRLRAAGAIPIGITNVPELMIFPWTASDASGITRNPWDPSRTPGGSSGGSAAAVAAGMVPCATASDGGGSIRIPAACCGLVGMKPSRGRVSSMPDAAHWLGLSTRGPLARTVKDSALMLDVMHGTIEGDTYTIPQHTGSYLGAASSPPTRLRIAISRKTPSAVIAPLSPDQRSGWEQTAGLLRDLGHDVSERDPAYGTVQFTFVQTWLRGIYDDTLTVPDHSKLERSTRQMAAAGRLVSERRANRLRGELRARASSRILALWDEIDVLMTPVLATAPIAAEGGYGRSAPVALNISSRFTPWTSPFNLTGQPAVSIPAGCGADGLPLSVQLVGRPGAEDVLYALAGQIEAARPWTEARPSLPTKAGVPAGAA
jgi:amidase